MLCNRKIYLLLCIAFKWIFFSQFFLCHIIFIMNVSHGYEAFILQSFQKYDWSFTRFPWHICTAWDRDGEKETLLLINVAWNNFRSNGNCVRSFVRSIIIIVLWLFSITSSLSLEFKQFRICTLELTIFVSINRPFTIISFSVLKIVCSSWLYWILFLLLFDILPWEDEYCYCGIDRQFIEYPFWKHENTI